MVQRLLKGKKVAIVNGTARPDTKRNQKRNATGILSLNPDVNLTYLVPKLKSKIAMTR